MLKKEKLIGFTEIAAISICIIWFLINFFYIEKINFPFVYDAFRDLSAANNISHDRLWSDPAYSGFKLWYPPLLPLITTVAGSIFNIPLPRAFVILGPFLNLLIPFFLFFVLKRLYNSYAAFFAVFIIMFVMPWTAGQLSWFTQITTAMIFIPIVFYLYFKSLTDNHIIQFVFCGLMLGISIYHHLASSFMLCLLITVNTIIQVIEAIAKKGIKNALKPILEIGKPFIIIAGTAAAVSSIFLVNYLMNGFTVLNREPHDYLSPNMVNEAYLFFGGNWFILLSLVSGVFICILNIKLLQSRLLLIFAGILLIGELNGLLRHAGWSFNIDLLRKLHSILPPHEYQFYLHYAGAVFSAIGITVAVKYLAAKIAAFSGKSEYENRFSLGLLLIVFFSFLLPYMITSEKYIPRAGYAPEPDWSEAADWINRNIPIDEVFLCEVETAYFKVNGLTGRKVVVTHDGHSNPAADYNARLIDMRELYATGDIDRFKMLANKYNIRYVVLSDEERRIANVDKFDEWQNFKLLHQSGNVKIYGFDR